MATKFFTSESVTEGHPDKVCDRVSDAVLDAMLAQDPMSRVACETATTTGLMLVMGEVTSRAVVDIAKVARKAVADIGYTDTAYGFDANTCAMLVTLDGQSPDIAQGVDAALEVREQGSQDEAEKVGAGDQGMMFGYACDETEELMPMPISLAHAVSRRLAQVRHEGILPWLRPDGKSQITVQYEDGQPVRVDTVVISTQHAPEVDLKTIRDEMVEQVAKYAIPAHLIDRNTRFLVNPTGRFVVGGPMGDSGLTGRKIIVDTYGGYAPHGGGAFSGKDPTKVDRSAAYAARYAAKNVVAAGLAKRCEIELAYSIGVAHPVSVLVDTKGTGAVPDERLARIVQEAFDFRPAGIIKELDLRRPIYAATSAYGHFGRTDVDLPWERTDKVEQLKKLV